MRFFLKKRSKLLRIVCERNVKLLMCFAILLVSYANLTGTACPSLFLVPVCYIVNFAYGAMLGSLVLNRRRNKPYFFYFGWSIGFVIALLASIAELASGGGACPSVSEGGAVAGVMLGVPLCYISLFVLIIVLILFSLTIFQRDNSGRLN